MTVSTTLDRQYFDGDGSNVNFPFDFKFLDNSDIYVWVISPTGVATPQALTTNYTLTGALNDNGGQVTMLAAPPLTVPATRVLIQRIVQEVQPTSIRNQGKFFAEVHENVFDRLTMLIQQALSAVKAALPLDLSGLFWNAGGKRITQVADPVNNQDAATKYWTDVFVANLITQIQGPINNANNVFYQAPDGTTKVVQQMSGAIGAGLIGYDYAQSYFAGTVGAELKLQKNKSDRVMYFDDFTGVVGNNVNNDTAGMQAAILAIATAGGGTVFASSTKSYYIPGTLLIPSSVTLDFRNAKVRGNRAGNTNSMFATATLEGGILVDNRAAADDVKLVEFAHICNLRAIDAYSLFDFKNWIIGCTVSNVRATNCRQVIHANRCFYARWVNITAVGGSLVDVPTYHFLAQNNAIYLNRVSATTQWGFAFTGGSSAVHLDACTYEGGVLGFYVEGENHAFKWTGLYAEAVQGVLFNFSDCSYISYDISTSYLNYVDVVLRDPEGVGAICEGTWAQNNDLVNVGVTVGGFLYRGLIYKRGARSAATLDLATSFGSEATLPANIITDTSGMSTARKISIREGTGAGDVLSKGIILGGVIPLHYTGDTGRDFTNQVPFCTHSAASASVVRVETRILLRNTTFARYRFEVVDSLGTYQLFGDIYGPSVKVQDATGKTVTVAFGTNGLRIDIGGLTISGGVYTCKGTVQILS